MGDQPPGLLAELHVALDELANLPRKVELFAHLPELSADMLNSLLRVQLKSAKNDTLIATLIATLTHDTLIATLTHDTLVDSSGKKTPVAVNPTTASVNKVSLYSWLCIP